MGDKSKKAQISESILFYAIAVIIVVGVLAIGVTGIFKLIQTNCNTEIQKLKTDLSSSINTLSGKPSSTEELNFNSVCGADLIYFIDNDNALPEMFGDRPEIEDSLSTGAKSNVFLFKKGVLLDSFYAGRIYSTYPSYNCIESEGYLSFKLVGNQIGVNIPISNESQKNCIPSPGNLIASDLILAGMYQKIGPQEGLTYSSFKQKVDLTSPVIEGVSCQKSEDGKKLDVYLGYKQELNNFVIYHKLPQCVLPSSVNSQVDLSNVASVYPIALNVHASKSWIDETSNERFVKFSINTATLGNGVFLISYALDAPIPDNCLNIDYCNLIVVNDELCKSDSDCISNLCQEDGKCVLP